MRVRARDRLRPSAVETWRKREKGGFDAGGSTEGGPMSCVCQSSVGGAAESASGRRVSTTSAKGSILQARVRGGSGGESRGGAEVGTSRSPEPPFFPNFIMVTVLREFVTG